MDFAGLASGRDMLGEALLVARHHHRNQEYDIFPYSYHIDMVVAVGKEYGFPEQWLVGCALHDIVEDCNMSVSKVTKFFGEPVGYIVSCVTDNISLPNRKEKKADLLIRLRVAVKRGLLGPLAVKLADRIANGEYSRRNGSSQFSMYVKEYPDFRRALYDAYYGSPELDSIMSVLWARCDKLFNFRDYG
jgi:(p)ppGpp synthase/HD superfamily hydrolase